MVSNLGMLSYHLGQKMIPKSLSVFIVQPLSVMLFLPSYITGSILSLVTSSKVKQQWKQQMFFTICFMKAM